MSGHMTGRFADQGLANTLGLNTLRHGTNLISWLAIHIIGALPSMGGSSVGGDAGFNFDTQNINKFYLIKDSGLIFTRSEKSSCIWNFFERSTYAFGFSRIYAGKSTLNLCTYILGGFGRINLNQIILPKHKKLFQVIGLIIGIFHPILKFRCSPEVAASYTDDDTLIWNAACSTHQGIAPWNIGILGTVSNSLTLKTFNRILDNRQKLITGLAQLALAGCSAYYLAPLMTAHRTAFIAGAILGFI
ncbi:MAG: hypothetical protein ACRDFB_03980 [Rhabdochlamydiaceae bacterium]